MSRRSSTAPSSLFYSGRREATILMFGFLCFFLGCFILYQDKKDILKTHYTMPSTTNDSGTLIEEELNTQVVLAYGDSLTYGMCGFQEPPSPYAKFLQAQLPANVQVLHLGLPGWTTRQMLNISNEPQRGISAILKESLINSQSTNRNPESYENNSGPSSRSIPRMNSEHISESTSPIQLCILLSGTNDLGHGKDVDTIVRDLVDLHRLCHEQRVPTLAIGVPSSLYQARNEAARQRREQINQQLEQYAASQSSNSMMTFVPFPFEYDDKNRDNWCRDGLHFSPHGYRVLGEYLVPFVRTALAIPAHLS